MPGYLYINGYLFFVYFFKNKKDDNCSKQKINIGLYFNFF